MVILARTYALVQSSQLRSGCRTPSRNSSKMDATIFDSLHIITPRCHLTLFPVTYPTSSPPIPFFHLSSQLESVPYFLLIPFCFLASRLLLSRPRFWGKNTRLRSHSFLYLSIYLSIYLCLPRFFATILWSTSKSCWETTYY